MVFFTLTDIASKYSITLSVALLIPSFNSLEFFLSETLSLLLRFEAETQPNAAFGLKNTFAPVWYKLDNAWCKRVTFASFAF
jgi:hypothetical protein